MVEEVLWHSLHVLVALILLASVARLPALEVIVAALAALPATRRELAVLSLLLSLNLVAHALLASVACLASLEVVVQALVAVPASLWELEGLLSMGSLGGLQLLYLEFGICRLHRVRLGTILVKLRVYSSGHKTSLAKGHLHLHLVLGLAGILDKRLVLEHRFNMVVRLGWPGKIVETGLDWCLVKVR